MRLPKNKRDRFREMSKIILLERIQNRIYTIHERKVMLDSDLAALYGVTTKRLNEQVKRNRERFPEDFMFQLTSREYDSLRSQNATLKTGRGQHRKYLPRVFTEHGAVMAANVLNSPVAIEASIYVVRAFMKQRELIAGQTDLYRKLAEIETRLFSIRKKVGRHDKELAAIVSVIDQLMNPPQTPAIGFQAE